MSIFLTAYETLAGSGYKHTLSKIELPLEQAIVDGQYVVDENDANVLRLYSHELTSVPSFIHPIAIKDNESEDMKIVLDLRSYCKLDRATGDYIVKLTNESVFNINRAILNEIWVNKDPFTLLSVSPLPMVVFSSIISENISRRLALDPREQLSIAITAAYYYYCLFSDNDKFDEMDTTRIISSISRNLRCSSADVIEIMDRVGKPIFDINDFCEVLEKTTGSVRLRKFNTPLLFQILGGIWFGVNARDLVCAGLEHPPTWIALVHAAYTERSYRNTLLAKTAERKTNKAGADIFGKSIYNLVTNP